MNTTANSLLLIGLDGANPLAFLAALGTLRTLTLALPDETVRMGWQQADGAWRPRVWSGQEAKYLVDVLTNRVCGQSSTHPVLQWHAWLSKQADQVTAHFHAIDLAISNRIACDYTSAIGSDAAPPDDDGISDNPFRAARTDYFIKNIEAIIARCTPGHLKRALVERWDYADAMENQSLRLDPQDDRRHAHQWDAPTTDATRKRQGNMLGANRLAIEAYPFFQSTMVGKTLATTGFSKPSRSGRRFRWPIWNNAISQSVVSTIVAVEDIWMCDTDGDAKTRLAARGICQIYESTRIKVGSSNPRTNFTPARAI